MDLKGEFVEPEISFSEYVRYNPHYPWWGGYHLTCMPLVQLQYHEVKIKITFSVPETNDVGSKRRLQITNGDGEDQSKKQKLDPKPEVEPPIGAYIEGPGYYLVGYDLAQDKFISPIRSSNMYLVGGLNGLTFSN